MLTTKLIGNLGNQLFQLWSMAGMAMRYNHRPYDPPEWPHYNVFEGSYQNPAPPQMFNTVNEREFTYHEWQLPTGQDHMVTGYRQSEKYWKEWEGALRAHYRFKPDFLQSIVEKLPDSLFDRPAIVISIRRGDFVNNPVYYQLPINYYIGALFTHFPDWQEKYNLLFLSDDLPYCKVHFECLPNAYFADGLEPIEQLCAAVHIGSHYIISNSTFSWWCAYMGNPHHNKTVIRPKHNFGEEYRKTHPERDFWPEHWQVFDHEQYKIDLSDVTFTIPVAYDHKDRKQNLGLSVCMLQRDFHTNVRVMEHVTEYGPKMANMAEYCEYSTVQYRAFHRTKMLNIMALEAKTPIVANWDADVFVPPVQIWLAVEAIRKQGKAFVYPYDGRFARVTRDNWFRELQSKLDTGIFGEATHFGKSKKGAPGKPMATTSVGGAVFVLVEAFIHSGMENEHMISYAPEDAERWDRWHALEYPVARIKGKLFHMDHYCGPDSGTKHQDFAANRAELDKERAMTPQQLRRYVDSWPWKKFAENEKSSILKVS